MHWFQCFPEFHPVFSNSFMCTLMVRFLFLMCLDRIATSSMNDKCFKLQVWGFKLRMWSVNFWVNDNYCEWKMLEVASVRVQVASVKCRVFEWPNVRVRCRIFELMKGRNNKKSRKPSKAYSHPIHHRHRARGLSMEGCHVRGALMEGSSVMLLTIT